MFSLYLIDAFYWCFLLSPLITLVPFTIQPSRPKLCTLIFTQQVSMLPKEAAYYLEKLKTGTFMPQCKT